MKLSTIFRHRARGPLEAFAMRIAGLLTLALLLLGCGNTLYLVQVNQAEEAFEEARELGAEQYAPYEYYSAEARLKEAKMQAAQAEYGNASDLSDEAKEYAHKAIVRAKKGRNLSAAPPAPVGVAQ